MTRAAVVGGGWRFGNRSRETVGTRTEALLPEKSAPTGVSPEYLREPGSDPRGYTTRGSRPCPGSRRRPLSSPGFFCQRHESLEDPTHPFSRGGPRQPTVRVDEGSRTARPPLGWCPPVQLGQGL